MWIGYEADLAVWLKLAVGRLARVYGPAGGEPLAGVLWRDSEK